MWDQHMHCMFSGDSDADPVLMIKSAISKGLDGICFTDHLDYDYKEELGLFDLDIAAYEKRIKRLAIVLKEKGCPVNIHDAFLHTDNMAISQSHKQHQKYQIQRL